MKEKIMIYPFSDEIEFYVQHSNLLNKFEIKSLVSFKGAGYLTRKYKVEEKCIHVSEKFSEELEMCTALLPVFSNEKGLEKKDEELASLMPNVNELILDKIKIAISKEKKIVILDDRTKETEILLKAVPKELQICIKKEDIDSAENVVKKMYNIESPVVFLGSAFEGLNEMNLLLTLYEGLTSKGYRILAFGTRGESELFGIHSYPHINMEDSERIVFLNNYIKMMENKYKPDIILMSVPGGTAPFSMKAPLDFGTELFRMIRACMPDYAIISIPYAQYTDLDIVQWSRYYKRNFGMNVDAYNIVPKAILQQLTETYNDPKYLSVDRELVEKILEKTFDFPVYSYSSSISAENLVDCILLKLQGNKITNYV